jgi:hypothetical protein
MIVRSSSGSMSIFLCNMCALIRLWSVECAVDCIALQLLWLQFPEQDEPHCTRTNLCTKNKLISWINNARKTTILCGLTSKISFTMKLHINHIICEIWNIYVYNMQWHWHIWPCNFKMDIGGLHNYSQIKSSLWHDIYDYVDVINVVGLPILCIYMCEALALVWLDHFFQILILNIEQHPYWTILSKN